MHLRLSSYIVFLLFKTTASWNYAAHGPDVWSEEAPTCAGLYQSPINILTACTTYQNFVPFQFATGYDGQYNFMLANNGHTITSTYQSNSTNSSFPFQLSGGGLNGTFQFVNFHLHWGQNHKSGSEHQVNGLKYAGEIHFVHTNPVTQQTAVLGLFMQSYDDTNGTHAKRRRRDIATTMAQWQIYFNAAQTLKTNGSSISISLNLASLISSNLTNFWRYQGSLTVPPCTEGIIWTVFKQPIIFFESELTIFRNNLFPEGFRGPQLLHNRTIYRNFLTEDLPTDSDYLFCTNGQNCRGSNNKSISCIPMHFFMYLCIFIIVFNLFSLNTF